MAIKGRVEHAYEPFAGFDAWRSLLIDQAGWDQRVARLNTDVDKAFLARAREVAKRAAAIESGAIEGLYETDRGFTITVATQAAYWTAAFEKKEERVRRLIDSQFKAYDEVVDFATGKVPIAQAWIRQLHEILCAEQPTYTVYVNEIAEQRPLSVGEYKQLPNNVFKADKSIHWYAPPESTAPEMARLCDELVRPEFSEAHPVLQAAFAHYALVAIHPFADGNGRVARALGSVFTYRAASIPILILTDTQQRYYDALAAADGGDTQQFANFVFARCMDAFALIEQSIRTARFPAPEAIRAEIRSLFATRGGFSHHEVDAAGYRVLSAVQTKMTERAGQLVDSDQLTYSLELHNDVGEKKVPEGYRWPVLQGNRTLKLVVRSGEPAVSSFVVQTYLFVPIDSGPDDEILIDPDDRLSESLLVRMRDAHPNLDIVAELNVAMYVDAVLGSALQKLRAKAEQALRKRGY